MSKSSIVKLAPEVASTYLVTIVGEAGVSLSPSYSASEAPLTTISTARPGRKGRTAMVQEDLWKQVVLLVGKKEGSEVSRLECWRSLDTAH